MHSSKSASLTSPGSPGSPKGGATVSPVQAWMMAIRIPTLPAAVVPVVVASAAAWGRGSFHTGVFVAALLGSLLIQIGTNFANDLYDFRKGADTEERLGPVRATAAGLLSERDMARGTVVVFGLATLIGLYLVYVGGWVVFAIGIASIAAGVLYTAGPFPLGYHGLGDVFTFVFFGLVAVVTTYYLHTGVVDSLAWLASLPVGFLVTAILVVNNLRDMDTDRAAGKRTLAVRIGRRATKIQYTLLVAGAYVMPLLMARAGMMGGPFWLPFLSLPLGIRLIRFIWTAQGAELNLGLKDTGRLHLLFGILFSIALLWAGDGR